MIPELLAKLFSANPEKSLDALSKLIDLVREHPPLQAAPATFGLAAQ